MTRTAINLLARYVEHGQQTEDEVMAQVRQAATSSYASLNGRPVLRVSLPGSVVTRLGQDVLIGVPGQVLDDHGIRKISKACPEVWLDGRWFPADVGGIHLIQVRSLTVVDPGGIAQDVAALLDVPADDARFGGGTADSSPRFVRLSWRT